jgi:hypothetical protein
MPYGKEIIWFDIEINNIFDSSTMVSSFKKHIMKAVYNFFSKNYVETGE